MSKIPKIIHQLWIGDKPCPQILMNTWKEKHPEFEYIFWNEEEIKKREFTFVNQNKIDEMVEINGKADIMRWEILEKMGGIFIDADSICLNPLDKAILSKNAFAGYENEELRGELIATGTMGFPPNHIIPQKAVEWIKNNDVMLKDKKISGVDKKIAWYTVGPGLLTRVVQENKLQKNIHIFPSHYFLPEHYTGHVYEGHSKVYAYQKWGSTQNNYDKINNTEIPTYLENPKLGVSILIPVYNTKVSYIRDCLESIKQQVGLLMFQVVIVNDGSDNLHSALLEKLLENLINTSRWIQVKYIKNETNKGLGFSLDKGLRECYFEHVFRMDADDIMLKDRIVKQIMFLQKNMDDCFLMGAQVQMFSEGKENRGTTCHPNILWEEWSKNEKMRKRHWLMNHPTYYLRKSKILECGSYNNSIHSMCEDFDLILRVLKKYGKIYNMPDIVLKYRLHPGQLTFNGGIKGGEYWKNIRNQMIEDILKD
jgi:GT2 family glycosyltransferase